MPITSPKERTLPGSPTDRRPEIFPRRTRDECAGFFMPDSPPRYGTMPEPNRFFLSPWLRFPAIFSEPPFSPLYSRRSPAAPPPSDRFRPFFRFTGNRVSPCDLSVRLSAPYGISIAPKRKGDNGMRSIYAFHPFRANPSPLKRVATSYARRLRKSEGSLLNRK